LPPRHHSARPPTVLETRVVKGSGGGPDKTILNSPRFLAESGYRTLCAYLHPPGDPGFEQLRQKAQRWQAPLVSIPDRSLWDWKVVPLLLNVCRRERVSIWHGHDYKSNALGLLLRGLEWAVVVEELLRGVVEHVLELVHQTKALTDIGLVALERYHPVAARPMSGT